MIGMEPLDDAQVRADKTEEKLETIRGWAENWVGHGNPEISAMGEAVLEELRGDDG